MKTLKKILNRLAPENDIRNQEQRKHAANFVTILGTGQLGVFVYNELASGDPHLPTVLMSGSIALLGFVGSQKILASLDSEGDRDPPG